MVFDDVIKSEKSESRKVSTMHFAKVATLFHRTCATAGLDIYVFNVGQADSQLIVFPSGDSTLSTRGRRRRGR